MRKVSQINCKKKKKLCRSAHLTQQSIKKKTKKTPVRCGGGETLGSVDLQWDDCTLHPSFRWVFPLCVSQLCSQKLPETPRPCL